MPVGCSGRLSNRRRCIWRAPKKQLKKSKYKSTYIKIGFLYILVEGLANDHGAGSMLLATVDIW